MIKIALIKSPFINENKTFISCSKGLSKAGYNSKMLDLNDNLANLSEYDVCCIQGTWDDTGKSLKRERVFNKSIVDYCKSNNKPVLVFETETLTRVIDKSYSKNGLNKYHRIGYDHWLWGKGKFIDIDDDCRWQHFKSKYNLNPKPWRSDGDKVLIILGYQNDITNDLNPLDFLDQSVKEIKKHTDRPIWVKLHPSTYETKQISKYLKYIEDNNLFLCNSDLLSSLENTWAVVMYKSTSIFEVLYSGVPAFVHPENFGAPICLTDLSKIENPLMIDREDWFSKMAWTCWSRGEFEGEHVWHLLLNFA